MKKVAVLFAEGFEEIEGLTVVDILRRAGFTCDMVSVNGEQEVQGSHGIKVITDKLFDDSLIDYDMIVLPGGEPGATNLKNDERVLKLLGQVTQESSKTIGAICAAPSVLAAADIVEGKRVTSYPAEKYIALFNASNYLDELVVVDDNIVTSRGPATAMLFAYTLVEMLGGNSEELRKEMLYDQVLEQKEESERA